MPFGTGTLTVTREEKHRIVFIGSWHKKYLVARKAKNSIAVKIHLRRKQCRSYLRNLHCGKCMDQMIHHQFSHMANTRKTSYCHACRVGRYIFYIPAHIYLFHSRIILRYLPYLSCGEYRAGCTDSVAAPHFGQIFKRV